LNVAPRSAMTILARAARPAEGDVVDVLVRVDDDQAAGGAVDAAQVEDVAGLRVGADAMPPWPCASSGSVL
jgi:hypothetical protein